MLERAGLKLGIIRLHGKFAFYDTINFKMTECIEKEEWKIQDFVKSNFYFSLKISYGTSGRLP